MFPIPIPSEIRPVKATRRSKTCDTCITFNRSPWWMLLHTLDHFHRFCSSVRFHTWHVAGSSWKHHVSSDSSHHWWYNTQIYKATALPVSSCAEASFSVQTPTNTQIEQMDIQWYLLSFNENTARMATANQMLDTHTKWVGHKLPLEGKDVTR